MNKITKLISITLLLCYSVVFSQNSLNQNTYNRNKFSLNGLWKVIIDPYDNGSCSYRLDRFDQMNRAPRSAYFRDAKVKNMTDRLEYNFDSAETLMVPGSWNMQKEKFYWYEGSMWYRKLFKYSKEKVDNKVFLRFEAVNYHCCVYLNGEKVGEHTGGFTPFEFQIESLLREGDNSLVVLVNNNRHKDAVPTINTDWFNYGGITRDVFIYEVSKNYIKDYKIELVDKKSVVVGVTLSESKKGEEIIFEIPELSISKKLITNNNGKATLKIRSNNIKYWSPSTPKLYDIVLKTKHDKMNDQIGFRIVETSGKDILLNGKPIFLKGISIHEENPLRNDRAFSIDDAKIMLEWAKELGCNFVRLAHYPHNENMVRMAEEMGLMVWEEIPVYWTISWESESTYQNAQNQLSELISRDKNRASVVVWSMSNETPPGEARTKFLKRLVDFTRKNDNSRLISAALEKHRDKKNRKRMIVEDNFAEYVDVVSFNEYIGWYTGKPSFCEEVIWDIKYDKPVIISEFGGGALAGYHGDKTTQWTEEFQEDIYIQQLKMLSKIPQWAGATPWILADFKSPRRPLAYFQDGFNRKGLISNKGKRKKAFYILQKFYNSKK